MQKELLLAAIFAARGDTQRLRELARRKSFLRIPRKAVVEALLEVHLFAGYPATIDAFIALRGLLNPSGHQRVPPALRSRQGRRQEGVSLCKRVYGPNYSRLMENMESLNPDLAEWIIEDGYGRVLSRGILSPVDRELVAVAVLAALGWWRQLRSHALGARNLGAPERTILQAVALAGDDRRRVSGKAMVLLVRDTLRRSEK